MSELTGWDAAFAKAKAEAIDFMEAYNDTLRRFEHCRACGAPGVPGLKCVCGALARVPRWGVLIDTETGYDVCGIGDRSHLIARFDAELT